MCKIQVNKINEKKHHNLLKTTIKKIPVGSSVFIKWYDVKTHKPVYTPGVLIAKRGKGLSSHIIIRRVITKEVVTTFFYLYAKTFLGIGLLGKSKETPIAKKYNYLLRPIRWKYI
jgi:ribosomal protein L19